LFFSFPFSLSISTWVTFILSITDIRVHIFVFHCISLFIFTIIMVVFVVACGVPRFPPKPPHFNVVKGARRSSTKTNEVAPVPRLLVPMPIHNIEMGERGGTPQHDNTFRRGCLGELSGSVWVCLEPSGAGCGCPGLCGTVWGCLGLSGAVERPGAVCGFPGVVKGCIALPRAAWV